MAFVPSFPSDATVRTVMAQRPEIYRHWHQVGEGIMRGDSPFTPGERELIAGFVSGLNACAYCHGAHTAVAVAFGFPENLMPSLLDNIDEAPIDDKMKPVLKFIKKLTLTPAQMTAADAEAIFAAGWKEIAVHDAVAVCCYFNFMNRLVFGHGIEFDPDPDRVRMLAERKKQLGYANRGDLPEDHPLVRKVRAGKEAISSSR
jgi:uncharacterized peroxidase-related enzyme